MNNFKKLLTLLLAVAMVLTMGAVLTACGGGEGTDGTTAASGEKTAHTVTVKTAGGMPMEGVEVYVYADDTLGDLKQYGETDANGAVTFEMESSDRYAVTVSGAPKGYAVDASYAFSGTSANITLTSSVVEDESLSGATLGLGDVMYDFSVTTPDGDTVKLSEMLKEKEMVLLNFWFSTCGPCANEFPYMDEAYQMYQDKVGIIAVDPLEENNTVGTYQKSMGLSFPMAACPPAWSSTFNISGYPTSIIIDRYGVICLIEVGGITSLRPFTSIFETLTGDDYTQKLYTSVGELVTNVKPTYQMDTSENVAAILNNGQIEVTYRPETEGDSAEYSWPFIQTEKNGQTCMKASNQEIDGSFAILYADVTLKAGQAVGFDYLISSEKSADVMHVIVNDEAIYQISGVSDPEQWKPCYPLVAEEDGTYEIALCYIKDESTNQGDDTVYIKNMRVVDPSQIDEATYLPRQAAISADGFDYTYVDIVYNESDGYYHVGEAGGPLLLADLMGYTQFSEEQSVWEMAYSGDLVAEGVDYAEQIEIYANYASNASLTGVCTVNQELYELLQKVDQIAGFDDADTNEWLKLCKYYQVYGSDQQLEDPIAGLAPFSAYKAKEGTNVESNAFHYNRIIMPRGMVAEFVPSRSGVYRITSRSDSTNGVDGWIFDENHQELLVYEFDERMHNDSDNVSMVFYMEAGRPYYIDIAFWDPYEVGTIYYDIEYIASTFQLFRLCSPGYFTYDSDATGEAMYYVIAGGIKAVLGSDGYYYEDLGNGQTGSRIYADFVGVTSIFDTPISTVDGVKGMIEKGGFDFSKTEDDLYILGIMAENDNDEEKTKKYLQDMWGEDYDSYVAEYQLDDVFAGKFHGEGEDLTDEISTYLNKIITSGSEEIRGCVPVDARLAEILQLLMDKYTFENVDQAWLKLCYYYDYLGPEG